MTRATLRGAAVCAALALLPALALAQPSITSVTPSITSANTGATVTVSGSGFGASDDRVYFPGTSNWVNPTSWGSGWVVCRVPATWSGNVQVQSHGTGALSNGVNHNISFSRYAQWSPASMTWWLNQNGAPGCTVNETANACADGYDVWVCASSLSANYQGTTATNGSNHTDGINVLCWVNSGWGDPSVIAVCSSRWWIASENLIEFDINFNSQNWTWSCAGAAGAMDVQNIAAHEEGHSIGFGDLYGSYDFPKTMYGYSANGQITHRTLEPEDVEGAEYSYPHAGRANLTAGTPSGWYGPLVPRNTNDATDTYAPLPSSLSGNVTTYLNGAQTNNGGDCATPYASNDFYVDDGAIVYWGWTGIWSPGVTLGLWRNWAMTVRGGRHTLKHVMDADADIVESNESDNVYQAQFVWSPYGLADQVAVTRAVPPVVGPFAANNCDGFQFTGNWWGCVAIIPTTSGDDYDLQLFNDYVGSTTGYSTVLAGSAWGGTSSDFVLVNGNVVGNGPTRWVGVDRYAAVAGGDFVICQSNQVGATLSPDTVYNHWLSTSTTITGSQIVKVHEIYLSSPTRTYTFKLTNTSGTADLNISLYDRAGDYFGKSDYEAVSMAVGGGTNESFNYRPPAPGYYGLVVWKSDANDLGKTNDYTLEVGVALSNINATVTPGGFSSPVVPRNLNDASLGNAVLTPTLDGNTADTYLNWATQQEGPNNLPAWGERIYVDVDWYAAWGAVPNNNWPTSWQAVNIGAITIRGGRHSIRNDADWDAVIAEPNESDNTWEGQWVWSPLVTTRSVPLTRAVPPVRGTFGQPNADGMQFTRTSGYAWVVSLAPLTAGDDYDLWVYDDYSGSSSGFSNLRGLSGYGSNATDFVVGHYSGTPLTVLPAAVRYSTGGGGGGFVADQTDALGRNGDSRIPGEVLFPSQSLGANRLADVYEGYFWSGTTYHLALTRTSGTADLAFAIFSGTSGGIWSRFDATANSVSVSAARDTLAFTASVTGWHPIVVYRPTGTDVSAAVYNFAWNERSTVAVPAETEPTPLALAGARPNPFAGQTQVEFSLAAEGAVTLAAFDLNGRRVRTLAEGRLRGGPHIVTWKGDADDGRLLEAGLYWIRLEAGGRTFVRRVTVLK